MTTKFPPIPILAAALIAGGAHDLAAQEVVFIRAQRMEECGRLGIALEPGPQGLVIQELIPGSPADLAGLQPGETLVTIGGRPATPAQLEALTRTLAPGDTTRLRVRGRTGDRDVAIVAARDLCPKQVVVAHDPEELRVMVRRLGDLERAMLRVDTVRVNLDSLRQRHVIRLGSGADSLRRALAFRASALADSTRRLFEVTAFGPGVRPVTVQGPISGDIVIPPGPAFVELEIGRRAVAGAEFSELNPGLAQYFEGAREGLLVLTVAPGTPSDRAGLRPGDVVIRANGYPIQTIPDLRLAIGPNPREPVTLEVIRKGERVVLRLAPAR
jgi:membrane-associated protease RseP (regulator of RpoE activity)